MSLLKGQLIAIENLLFKMISSSRGRLYCKLFNLFSKLHGHNVSLTHKGALYFLNESNWQFFHPKQGLMAYHKGLKTRADRLRQVYLIDRIKFNPHDVVIDCGANNGDFSLCFDNSIQYFGIEPSPIVFKNLIHNVKNGTCINKGLWNENSTIDFYLSDDYGDSSIIEPPSYTEKVSIETITLDQLIDQIDQRVKLIKLEAEGAEPEILQGLQKHLNTVEYISIDVGFERGIDQESTLQPCISYLTQNGFKHIATGTERLVVLFKRESN